MAICELPNSNSNSNSNSDSDDVRCETHLVSQHSIYRRKRREREAQYHQLDPLLEAPWVQTKVFDPYAETDFRTPTNQLEFDESLKHYSSASSSSYLSRSLPNTPKAAKEQRFSDSTGYLSPAPDGDDSVARGSSYSGSAATTLVDTDSNGKEPTYGYGHELEDGSLLSIIVSEPAGSLRLTFIACDVIPRRCRGYSSMLARPKPRKKRLN